MRRGSWLTESKSVLVEIHLACLKQDIPLGFCLSLASEPVSVVSPGLQEQVRLYVNQQTAGSRSRTEFSLAWKKNPVN